MADSVFGAAPKRYGDLGQTADQLKAQLDAHYGAGGSYGQVADYAAQHGINIDEVNRDWNARTAPPEVKPATFTPTLRTVDAANETIQGRLPGIMNSEVARQAETGALQAANSRGVLNSTMAIGAANDAVLKSAVPIAAHDADTYTNVANLNQGYQNQGGQFNAGEQNKFGLQAQQGQIQSGLVQQQANNEIVLQNLKGQQSKDLAMIEANYKSLMQTNDSVARFFAQTQASIADILKEPNIDPAGKDALVQKQIDMLKNYMHVAGAISGLQLDSLLTFPSAQAATTNTTVQNAATPPTDPGSTVGETRTVNGITWQWNGAQWVQVQNQSAGGE